MGLPDFELTKCKSRKEEWTEVIDLKIINCLKLDLKQADNFSRNLYLWILVCIVFSSLIWLMMISLTRGLTERFGMKLSSYKLNEKSYIYVFTLQKKTWSLNGDRITQACRSKNYRYDIKVDPTRKI